MSEYSLPARDVLSPCEQSELLSVPVFTRLGSLAIEEQVTGDREYSPNEHTILALRAGSDHPIISTLDQHRAKFVRDKQWMPPDHMTDFDRYDTEGMPTLSFVDVRGLGTGNESIFSSLRLTKLEKADSCLSFEMVNLDLDKDLTDTQQDSLRKAAESDSLYDLTRLLPSADETVSHKEYLASIIKLFGHGFYHTAIEPRQDPVWVCATEPGFRSLLQRLGIPSEVLKEARHDVPLKDQAVLYQIKPSAALENVKSRADRFAFTLKNAKLGINEARLTPIG